MHDLHAEPRLEDLYTDETLHILLAYDGLSLDDVRAVVREAQAALGLRTGPFSVVAAE